MGSLDSIPVLTLCLEKLVFQSIKRTMQMFSLTKFYILLEGSHFLIRVVSVEVKNPIHVIQRISGINKSVPLQLLNFNSFGIDPMAEKYKCIISFNTTVR